MLYRNAICEGDKPRANNIRGWRKALTSFPSVNYSPLLSRLQKILGEIYEHPRPFIMHCNTPWGCVLDVDTEDGGMKEVVSNVLVECRVRVTSSKAVDPVWRQWKPARMYAVQSVSKLSQPTPNI